MSEIVDKVEIVEEKAWTNEELWCVRWSIYADAWRLRHLCYVTPSEYETGIDLLNGHGFSRINDGRTMLGRKNGALIPGLSMRLRAQIPQYNAITNIPEELPEISSLLEMVTPWSEQDFQDKCNVEYGEAFGEEALAERIQKLAEEKQAEETVARQKAALEAQDYKRVAKEGPIRRLLPSWLKKGKC